LLEIDRAGPHYQLVVGREGRLDTLQVRVETESDTVRPKTDDPWSLEKKIARRIKEVLGLAVAVEVVPPKTLERSQGKAERIIDNRPPL
jgi:phenylacetate-CoA ligase